MPDIGLEREGREMPITQKEEEEQASIIQRELAKALSPSVQGVTDEPLPRRMVILLLRLVWAQTLRAMPGRRRRRSQGQSADRRSDAQA
jgi:hypothetical protein